MTTNELNSFLYTWINKILNTENNLGYEIIFSNRNAPNPSLPYFVIHDPPVSNQDLGRGNWGKWEFTNEPQDEGEVCYTKQYEASISLEEVGGSGDVMKLLLNSLNRQDIKDLFSSNKVGFLRNEPINPATDITEDLITRRAIMDIFVSIVDEGSYDPGYIDTVDYDGTYLGTKN